MNQGPAARRDAGGGALARPGTHRGRVTGGRAWLAHHPWVGDVGGALVAALLAVRVTVGPGWAGATTAVAVGAVVLVAVPLLGRRRRPVPVFASVLALGVTASVVLGRAVPEAAAPTLVPPGVAVLTLVALYAVAVRVRGPRLWAVVAGAEAAAMAGALTLSGARTPDGGVISLWAVLPVLAALPTAVAAMGANRRVRRDYLAALEGRAQRLESEREQRDAVAGAAERARIAREMHDLVAHSLTVVVTLADGIAAGATSVPPRAPDPRALAALASTGREALGEMRRLLGVLGEDGTGDDGRAVPGATAARREPQPGADDLEALAEQVRAAGLHVRLTREGPVPAAQGTVGLTVYRIVQEALTNALKHAGPGTSATVLVAATPGRVRVRVADDGLGRALGARPAHGGPGGGSIPGSHRGLRGMRERAAAFGGSVIAGPAQPTGWLVEVGLVVEDGSDTAARAEQGVRV